MNKDIIIFHKIKFYNKNFTNLFNKISKGGYLVAPAASSLSQIYNDEKYYHAIKNSNIAIFDSGFFCVLLRLFRLKKIKKFSGLLFLKNFIANPIAHRHLLLTIDPNRAESKKNHKFLRNRNFSKIVTYIAPNYSNSTSKMDVKLILLIKKIKPKYILINIGGGTQEVLAEYLYNHINKKISILCLGAAIAFLTGSQARISNRMDKFYLGWFARFVHAPKKYIFRILVSFTLVKLFF